MPDLTSLISAVAFAHQQAEMYEREHGDKERAKQLRRAAALLMLSGQLDQQAAALRVEATAMLHELLRG